MGYSKNEICIIIVNYKGHEDTIMCLTSLYNLNTVNFKIVVVDNSEQDASVNYIKRWAAGTIISDKSEELPVKIQKSVGKIKYLFINEGEKKEDISGYQLIILKAKQNKGFAAASNLGVNFIKSYCNCSWFWFLNNDTVVDGEVLNNFITYAEKNKNEKIGIIGTNLYYYYYPQKLQGIGGKYNKWLCVTSHLDKVSDDEKERETLFNSQANYIIGASMFVSQKFIDDVGLMDEKYFLYYEEVDWAVRGSMKGYKIGYASHCNVYHKEGGTVNPQKNKKTKSDLSDFYSVRSKLRITKKLFPQLLPIVLLSVGLSFFLRLWRLEFKQAFAIVKTIGVFFVKGKDY